VTVSRINSVEEHTLLDVGILIDAARMAAAIEGQKM
jgi:hypothetical protein